MGIIIDITDTDTGFIYSNTYHRIPITTYNRDGNMLCPTIKIYKSKADYVAGKAALKFKSTSNISLRLSGITSEKTINETYDLLMLEAGGTDNYVGNCPFNYRDDGIRSMAESQRDLLSSGEGDKVYNETTSKFQTYTSGSWVDDV